MRFAGQAIFNLAEVGGISIDLWEQVAKAGGGTILVPAGQWPVQGTVWTDFINRASQVALVGVGSASQIIVAEGGIEFDNLHHVSIENLVFDGRQVSYGNVQLTFSHVYQANMRNVGFYGCRTTGEYSSVIRSTVTDLSLESVQFRACAGERSVLQSGVNGAASWLGLSLRQVEFIDYGVLNGNFYTVYPFDGAWVRVEQCGEQNDAYSQSIVSLDGVRMDEMAKYGLMVVPDPATSAAVENVHVRGLLCNVGQIPGSAGVYVRYVKNLDVERSSFAYGDWELTQSDAINAGDAERPVDHVSIKKTRCVGRGQRITIHDSTKSLELEDTLYTELVSNPLTTQHKITKDGVQL